MNDADTVYAAEEMARENLPDEDPVPLDQAPAFLDAALRGAGWEGGAAELPQVVYDIADDDEHELAGRWDGEARAIRVHPRLATRWVLLHELAHYLRPLDSHGPQFCGVLVGLIDAGFGRGTALDLLAQFDEEGVEVDRSWIHDVGGGADR